MLIVTLEHKSSEFSSQFSHSAAYRRFQHTFMISSKNLANLLKQEDRSWKGAFIKIRVSYLALASSSPPKGI